MTEVGQVNLGYNIESCKTESYQKKKILSAPMHILRYMNNDGWYVNQIFFVVVVT